jgi:hypothetical protein
MVGIHGEAMYTALTLRSACSHSSCKLPMCGVKGQGPLPFSGGSKGGILFGKRIPPLFAPAACRRHLTFPFKGRKRYVGFLPVQQTLYGAILEYDLIFEQEKA